MLTRRSGPWEADGGHRRVGHREAWDEGKDRLEGVSPFGFWDRRPAQAPYMGPQQREERSLFQQQTEGKKKRERDPGIRQEGGVRVWGRRERCERERGVRSLGMKRERGVQRESRREGARLGRKG